MRHPIQTMMDRRRSGLKVGVPSYCSANELVLEAALLRAKTMNRPVLIEATANQVNQFGGYTGLTPADFYRKVLRKADEIGVPEEQVILGGDHLGPLTWQKLPEKEAMENARELVSQYVYAGFTKIHIDTSMKVADDPEGVLETRTIARRGVELYRAAMEAYRKRKTEFPGAVRPVFVIGSEVPIPGGEHREAEAASVTEPSAMENTILTYRELFGQSGLPAAWDDIVALVVQLGVEFGSEKILRYDRERASALCRKLKDYPGLCFEAHSTDYQSSADLKKMVEDGAAILKVGPALTYGLRETCYALSMMEAELVPEWERAFFIQRSDAAMLKDPGNWEQYYHGDERQMSLQRKYSFSDRCRYYIGQKEVAEAMEKLFANLRKHPVPMCVLHQYLPKAYSKILSGELRPDPRDLAISGICDVMSDYEKAVSP